MFACVHRRAQPPELPATSLSELAAQFSPLAQLVDPNTVVFSVAGLERLIGTASEIASAISQTGHRMKLEANLAIAFDPATAILAAQNLFGVTIVARGEEPEGTAGRSLPQ